MNDANDRQSTHTTHTQTLNVILFLVHLSVCGDDVCDESEDCDSCAVDCCGSELPVYVIALIVVLFAAVVAIASGGMIAVSEKYVPITTTH